MSSYRCLEPLEFPTGPVGVHVPGIRLREEVPTLGTSGMANSLSRPRGLNAEFRLGEKDRKMAGSNVSWNAPGGIH